MVYAIVTIGILQVIFDVVGIWMAWRLHEQSTRRIAIIERENIHLAGGVVKAQKAADAGHVEMKSHLAQAWAEEEQLRIDAIADEDAKIEQLNQRLLTLENKQPKIAPRPTRVNFRQFRAAMEASTEPEEAE